MLFFKRATGLLAVLTIGAIFVIHGIYRMTFGDLFWKNTYSTRLHLNISSHGRKLLVSRDEKSFSYPSSIIEHSQLSEGLQLEESIARTMRIGNSFGGRLRRRTRRRKRDASRKQSAWRFNLNVTRLDNQTSESSSKVGISRSNLHSDKQSKHLGISLHVEGKAAEDSYKAWNSVQGFLENLFGGNVEELSKSHDISVDFTGLPNKTFSSRSLTEDPESRNQPKDRKGKFLFGLLGGLGGNSENPPIDQGSGDPTNFTHPTTSIHDVKLSNDLKTTELPLNTVDEIRNFVSISESLSDLTDIEQVERRVTSPKFKIRNTVLEKEPITDDAETFSTSPTEFGKDILSALSNKQTKDKVKSIVSMDENELKGITENANVVTRNTNTADSFIVEEWEEFCNNLLQATQNKASRRLEELNNIEGSGDISLKENEANSMAETSHAPILTESIGQQSPQNLGLFLSFLNRITGGRFRPQFNTDSVSSNTSATDLETDNRKARIVDLNNPFGNFSTEKSTQLNEFENAKFNTDLPTKKNPERDTPSVLECETFLRHIRTENSMELKVVNPELNTRQKDVSISAQTTESQLTNDFQVVKENRFFSGLLDNDNTRSLILNDTEKQDRIESVGIMKDLVTEPTAEDASNESGRVSNVFKFESDLNIDYEDSELPVVRERRIWNIFNGGSGREMSDFLGDQSTEYQLTSTIAAQNLGLVPGHVNLDSEERNLEESLQFEKDDTPNLTSDKGERSFGGFFNLGSGDRQLQETSESTTLHFPKSEILQLEKANAREMYNTLDPSFETTLDFRNYDIDSKRTTADGAQTQIPNDEGRLHLNGFGKDDLIYVTESNKQKRRFLGFLNRGSGDGRELEENENSVTNDQRQSGCIVCTIDDISSSIKCTECSEISTEVETDYFTFETESEITPIDIRLVNAFRDFKQKQESNESFEEDVSPNARNDYIQSSTDSTSKTYENLIESKTSVLPGRLFLTGNGESNGEINLVHETDSTLSPSSLSPRSARRGRMHDEIPFEVQREEHESHLEDLLHAVVENKSVSEDFSKPSNSTTFSSYDFRTDSIIEMSAKHEKSGDEFDDSSTLRSNQIGTEIAESALSTTLIARTDDQRKTEVKKRVCTSAKHCLESLNERCVSEGQISVCDCGRSFVRHSRTRKCLERFLAKASMSFPNEIFHEDLKNENSELFKKKRNDSIATIMVLLEHDPNLMTPLVKVEISGFANGSLIVDSKIIFAKEKNESSMEIVTRLREKLSNAMKDAILLKKAPLDAEDANLLFVSAVLDRCSDKELNNCSPDAECTSDGLDFKCQCRDGFVDISREGYTGEVCIDFCSPGYCGENGFCDMDSKGERQCLCRGWYFGKRCQIPGLVVLVGFGVVNILVILVILVIVCICKRRRHRGSLSYRCEERQLDHRDAPHCQLSAVPARLRDTVALNEIGAAPSLKYTRSTPINGLPTTVNSPSIMGLFALLLYVMAAAVIHESSYWST